MKVTHPVWNGKDVYLLEATTHEEGDQLRAFGRPWDKFTAELHDDPHHKHPCLIIRKET